MTVEMDPRRVAHTASVLRAEVGSMQSGFAMLTSAERLSQDAALLAGVRTPLTEFLDETGRLAAVVEAYHDLTVNADRLHPTDRAQRSATLSLMLQGVARGLSDGVGATGSAAQMAAFGNALLTENVTSAETVLGWMDANGAEGFSADEFAALADDLTVPAEVRAAIDAFTTEPVMMANLQRAGWFVGTSQAITPEAFELFVATQVTARGFGERAVFDAFDGAKNGELDNDISWDDVHLMAEDDTASQELRALAQLIVDNPEVFRMIDNGAAASANAVINPLVSFNTDGRIAFGDAVATAVNMQAFDGRGAEARDFVMGLPSTNDFRDATGELLPIQWFSDSGVRSLANVALTATPTLSTQVGVVGRLPESPGGVRNLAITEYYRRIGNEIDLILNPDGDGGAIPLDGVGSTGTNWFMQGSFASAAIRPVLVDNNGYGPFTAGWAARRSMADGNQLLFDSLAPAAAAFIEAFPPGTEPTAASIELFFSGTARPDGTPLFVNGDRQLRDSFALLLDASTDSNPVTRQQTTFQSSLLIGVHEQALVDPFVDRAIGQDSSDGYRWPGALLDPDASIATGQIDPNLGGYTFDADRPLPTRNGHPDHVIGYDLTTTLNPIGVTSANIGGVTYDLSGNGNGDRNLSGLAGWDNVPDDWGVDSHMIDPAEWHDRHGWVEPGDDDEVKVDRVPGSTTGVPLPGRESLEGAAVDDWRDYPDRMWTIANSFQQTHTLPSMNTTVPGHGFDDADLSFLPAG